MKRILLIAAIALLAAACNKDQKVVKILDGTWNATKWTAELNGVTGDLLADGGSAKYTFTKCKIKDGEFCDMTWDLDSPFAAYPIDNEGNGLFTVTNDGGTLQTKDDLSSTTVNYYEIEEYTRKSVKLKQTTEFDFLGETITVIVRTTIEK